MIKKQIALKTILQVEEYQFREAGEFGDTLMGILREMDSMIKNNILTIHTALKFQHHDITISAFNILLQHMRRQNIVSIQVVLD